MEEGKYKNIELEQVEKRLAHVEKRVSKMEHAYAAAAKEFNEGQAASEEGRAELCALKKYVSVLASEFNKLAINTRLKKRTNLLENTHA